jgi:anti-anti-sigma regulatory factor
MALACLQPLVEEVFERAGFLSLFSTYPTLEDALLALE